MRTLSVALDARSYPIHIGTGLLADPGLILSYLKSKQIAVITNTVVGPLYLAPFVAALRERGLGDEVGGQGVVKVVQRERHQGSCGSGSTEHNDRLAAMSNIRG